MGGWNRKSVLRNKYENWVVIDDSFKTVRGKDRMVLCECQCENKTKGMLRLPHLKNGSPKSCGCKKITRDDVKTHGLTDHTLFKKWTGMKTRCYKTKGKDIGSYSHVEICDEWLKDFTNFYDWAISHGWEEGLQIDRIDNDGNYEPNNCRFVTPQLNALNRRLLNNRNTTGYCGVSEYNKKRKTRLFRFGVVNYEEKYNGYGFKTAKEAAIARDITIIENNLPHKLNFPELREKYEKEINPEE